MDKLNVSEAPKFPTAVVVVSKTDGSNTELLRIALKQLKKVGATGGEIS